jgi:hypothetical protein
MRWLDRSMRICSVGRRTERKKRDQTHAGLTNDTHRELLNGHPATQPALDGTIPASVQKCNGAAV